MAVTKKVLILHNRVPEGSPPDEADTLLQLNGVKEALTALGFTVETLAFSLDIETLRRGLHESAPSFVFNLVESVEGKGNLIYLAPALLGHFHNRYSGCSAESILLTTNKVYAKRLMRRCGLPTPDWITRTEDQGFREKERYILKPVGEDASIGLDDSSVFSFASVEDLRLALAEKGAGQRDYFAESFIDGREFNISIIGNQGKPEILPPAEMKFYKYEETGRPKIMGYRSKWDEESFEFKNTHSAFDFGGDDMPLLQELKNLSEDCWDLLDLRGYARIDFRVDQNNRPWILEVNPNPCITPSASGFTDAAQKAGLDYQEIIRRIVAEIDFGTATSP